MAVILYGRSGRSWWLFVALPAALGAIGVLGNSGLAVALALVWFAHIGMDRALGLGLQCPDGSGCTHLRASRRASNHPGPGGARWNA